MIDVLRNAETRIFRLNGEAFTCLLNIVGQRLRRAVLLTAIGWSDSKSDLLSPQLFEKIPIESNLIPTTNNATEQVIRHFDQHYQNFCGFENIETARIYIAVFEKVYRFTPLTQDARPELRGKCPLELAGYKVAKLPMAQICRGWALQWPAPAFQELVPNA